jgi:cytoskeletal protein CcmA (bactofilin family)
MYKRANLRVRLFLLVIRVLSSCTARQTVEVHRFLRIAVDVFIAGVVHGNVYATGHLQLIPTARVRGDVEYVSLDIANGAVIYGAAHKL